MRTKNEKGNFILRWNSSNNIEELILFSLLISNEPSKSHTKEQYDRSKII